MSRILLIDPISPPLIERMRPMFPAGVDLDMVSTLSEDVLANISRYLHDDPLLDPVPMPSTSS